MAEREVSVGPEFARDGVALGRAVVAEAKPRHWEALKELFLATKRREMASVNLDTLEVVLPPEVAAGLSTVLGNLLARLGVGCPAHSPPSDDAPGSGPGRRLLRRSCCAGWDEKGVRPGLDLVASSVLMVLTRFMKLWGRFGSTGGWDPLSLSGWFRCRVAPLRLKGAAQGGLARPH